MLSVSCIDLVHPEIGSLRGRNAVAYGVTEARCERTSGFTRKSSLAHNYKGIRFPRQEGRDERFLRVYPSMIWPVSLEAETGTRFN